MTQTENDGGYTIIFDWAVQAHGLQVALVYGAIWRYCQMRSGKCWASQGTIANRLGMSRRSVMRHIRTLVDAGLLTDQNPDSQGVTHEYTIAAGSVTVTCDTESQPPVTESHKGCDTESQPPVTESHTRITIKETSSSSAPMPPTPSLPAVDSAPPQEDPEVAAIFDQWAAVTGRENTPAECRTLLRWIDDLGIPPVLRGMQSASLHGVPKLAYVYTVACDQPRTANPRASPARAKQIAPGVFEMPVSTAHLRPKQYDTDK